MKWSTTCRVSLNVARRINQQDGQPFVRYPTPAKGMCFMCSISLWLINCTSLTKSLPHLSHLNEPIFLSAILAAGIKLLIVRFDLSLSIENQTSPEFLFRIYSTRSESYLINFHEDLIVILESMDAP